MNSDNKRKFIVVDFDESHFNDKEISPLIKLGFGVTKEQYADALVRFSKSKTVIGDDGIIYACFGSVPLITGIHDIWSCITSRALSYPMAMVKIGRDFVKSIKPASRRMQMACKTEKDCRYSESLGFIYEGPMYGYGEDGSTYYRYSLT